MAGGYQHQNWREYGNLNDFVIEINVTDSFRTELGHYVIHNEKQYQAVLKLIKDKFGMRYPVEIKEVEKKSIPLTMTAAAIKVEMGIEEPKKLEKEKY